MEKAHMQHIQECFKKYTFFVSHLSTARSSYLKFCSATVFSTFIYYMTLICTPHYPHPHPLRPNLFVICKNKLSLKSTKTRSSSSLQKQDLHQVFKSFQVGESYRILHKRWVALKTNVPP